MEPFRTEIQVRFNDTDALGHLNNTSYALYAEQGRVEFMDSFRAEGVFPEGVFVILARLELDFLKQVRYRDSVHVLTRVAKLGRTSLTLDQEVYGNGDLAARVRSVVVVFDYQAQQPTPIPERARELLAPYLPQPTG